MDTIAVIKKESAKFKAGAKRLSERRNAWAPFAERASVYFGSLKAEAAAQKLFENLYIDCPGKEYKGLPFLSFRWGNHPTGCLAHTEGAKLTIEGGCALHYAQAVNGVVFCIIYPFASELHAAKSDFYLFKIFSSPSEIADDDLQSGVKMLFACAHGTSYIGNASFADRARVLWLRGKSSLRCSSITQLAKGVFETVSSVASLVTS